MPGNLPATMALDDVLRLNLDDRIDDPALRRLVDCIRQINPAVGRATAQHGSGTIMASLIVVAVDMALRHADGHLIAGALRRNAAMLEAARLPDPRG
jgi:hypothetical protein